MSPDKADLAKISTFPQLVAYLRDELDWPIAGEDFEDLTFEYSAEELGIDSKNAAKIQEIKRLRPLSVNQPWGVFFVKFEPKRLPVVALRRILSSVVLKKRASANHSERAAWDAEDLLFISNYGEGDGRQISFAHFSQDPEKDDLPTLKVLGWDNLDTPLHIDHVAEELNEHLAWPEDEDDVEGWREAWRSAFTLRHREVVTTSKVLAVRLAVLARAIRDRIRSALAIETESGPLTKLMTAFQEALVHDLDEDGFADMYAQTIAYGLLSARIADPKGSSADDLAAHMPVTNPFLKELMETFLRVGGRRGKKGGSGIDFDEVGVNEVVELLNHANMEAVVLDFGDKNPEEDPVIHFYELFLGEYDKKQKVSRGVFYTPRPVVSYIVRSVDELLRTEFGLEDGLADTATWGEMAKRNKGLTIPSGTSPDQAFVQILDPATGTGTFLVEVIDLIHKTLAAKWKAQGHGKKKLVALWNEYVPTHLLSRLHGYELLMAPYAIAHLKIGLKLFETGYRFESKERVRVYLTNALDLGHDFADQLEFTLPALAHEARSVSEVKRTERVTVILGNPPYSKMSGNLSSEAVGFIEPFRSVDGVRIRVRAALAHELNLQDDYVKFYGFLLRQIQEAGVGIGAYISNFGFLDSPSLRGMRWNLLTETSRLDFLNLGGRVADRKETGELDENVFEIEQGVAISAIRRLPGHRSATSVGYARLSGSRSAKYGALGGSTLSEVAGESVSPSSPQYRFSPSDGVAETEFEGWPSLDELLPKNSGGIITSRDSLAIGWDSESLVSLVGRFAALPRGDTTLEEEIGYSAKSKWKVEECKAALLDRGISDQDVKPIYYRPFDRRSIYYFPALLDTPSRPISEMVYEGPNLVFLAPRVKTTRAFSHVLVSRVPAETKSCSHDRATQMFPMFLRDALDPETPVANLSFRQGGLLRELLGVKDGAVWDAGNAAAGYIYAVLYSPNYRSRYGDALRSSYPRIPMANDRELAARLADLGTVLIDLHLAESPTLDQVSATFFGPKRPEVGRVGWSNETVWLDAPATRRGERVIPGTMGFKDVPEGVWSFDIGGYQVCEKWLKDRKGRTLSKDDIEHYQKIVVALSETIRIMAEIDEVIEEHGGWPGAFAVGEK